jgi:hypothetical protein
VIAITLGEGFIEQVPDLQAQRIENRPGVGMGGFAGATGSAEDSRLAVFPLHAKGRIRVVVHGTQGLVLAA